MCPLFKNAVPVLALTVESSKLVIQHHWSVEAVSHPHNVMMLLGAMVLAHKAVPRRSISFSSLCKVDLTRLISHYGKCLSVQSSFINLPYNKQLT